MAPPPPPSGFVAPRMFQVELLTKLGCAGCAVQCAVRCALGLLEPFPQGTAEHKHSAQAWINQIRCAGMTNILDPTMDALEVLHQHQKLNTGQNLVRELVSGLQLLC